MKSRARKPARRPLGDRDEDGDYFAALAYEAVYAGEGGRFRDLRPGARAAWRKAAAAIAAAVRAGERDLMRLARISFETSYPATEIRFERLDAANLAIHRSSAKAIAAAVRRKDTAMRKRAA